MKLKNGLVLSLTCLSIGLVGSFTSQPKLQTIQAATTNNTKNFKQIKLGMNKRQVIDILGKPVHDKYEDNIWTYPVKDTSSVSLVFKKDTLENVSDKSVISAKNSVIKKLRLKQNAKISILLLRIISNKLHNTLEPDRQNLPGAR